MRRPAPPLEVSWRTTAERRIGLALRLAALAWAPAAHAWGDPEITHTKVVEPRLAAPVDPALEQIDVPMSFTVVGARLIVGASKGIAAIDADGNELDSARAVGAMMPLEHLPAGPVLWKNRVCFASSHSDKDKKPLLVAAKVGGGFDWDDRMDATMKTGLLSTAADTPMDIAVNGGHVFVATNCSVVARSAEWQVALAGEEREGRPVPGGAARGALHRRRLRAQDRGPTLYRRRRCWPPPTSASTWRPATPK